MNRESVSPGEDLHPAMRGGPRAAILEELIEQAPDAMLVVDAQGVLTLVNRRTEELFGWARRDLLGRSVDVLVPERLRSRHSLDRDRFVRQPDVRPMGEGRALLGRRRDGSEFPVEISLSPLKVPGSAGRPVHAYAAVVRDVSNRAALEAELVRLALHDPLTGLPNRTLAMDRLRSALVRARRGRTMTAVMFVDVDHFKWINDSLGHDIGDALIRMLGERMIGALRAGDTVARIGGDEFLVIGENVASPEEALSLGDRLVDMAREPVVIAGRELQLTISVGIAVTATETAVDSLVQDADDAMYRAKNNGRDRAELFRHEWRAVVMRELDISTALRRSIERGRLEVHYQPLIELRTGAAWGVECLLRWSDEQGRPLPAQDVVRLAEQSRLVVRLDRTVLATALADLADVYHQTGLRIGVNLSARYLPSKDLPAVIGDALARAGLPGDSLWLEITEGDHLGLDGIPELLTEVQKLGVRVAIDDFGVGSSSLGRLRDLPVDVLKIDKSFVAEIDHDYRSEALVGAIIGLAHALDIEVVGEGVERASQARMLAHLGCDLAQGFLWTPALPDTELRHWLAEHARVSDAPDIDPAGARLNS